LRRHRDIDLDISVAAP